MSGNDYAAKVGTDWRDFTPQHARTREQAFAIARGEHSVPAGAIVGVYGSGKSTLLFAVLAGIGEAGVLPVWEEASSFLDRLVPHGDRVSPQQFVERVHRWVEGLRTDSEVFALYKGELERRQLGGVAAAIEGVLGRPTDQVVLLLDEMEQAYPHFLRRIDTADHQPLRALIDSCGNSKVRLLMAYAPESFHALGDADRGRMLRLPVPSLNATAIQQSFDLTKGQANFAWWASRGRARGVIKVVQEVINPLVRGDFDVAWLGLAEALDGLPPVFGVPAVLRTEVPVGQLRDLLDLVPRVEPSGTRVSVIDIRDRPTLARNLTESLADTPRLRREEVEVVVDELLDVLDAVSTAEHRCMLTFDDFSAAVKLAVARAVESGRLGDSLEGLEPGRGFYPVSVAAENGLVLPFSLHRLADEIFPSPFTDPVLPLESGRLPTQNDVDRLFDDLAPEDPVLEWKEHGCLIFRSVGSLETWLKQELSLVDENIHWRALLLDERGTPGSVLSLAREAGRVAFGGLGHFHACFVKCLAIRARQSGLSNEVEIVAAAVRLHDRQLGRKADWHLARIRRLLEEMRPSPQGRWVSAIGAARGENLSGAINRISEDSPGLLALLYPFKPCRPETRRILAELAELLAENSALRKLARAAGPGKRFEGAAVVVSELLPGRPSSPNKRWVDTQFSGRTELTAILETFASPPNSAVLGKLLHPHAAARMERLICFHAGELPDLKPERQELEALQGINGVMERARLVHKGIQALLGVREEVAGLAIGKLISQAFAAQKHIGAFNKLGVRLDKIEEPWAKALALWVGAVFAERIWDGVERDEATLKVWETLSEQGKALARTIDDRLDELRELGFRSIAEFLSAERSRLRAGIGDAEQMQGKMGELTITLEQVAGLSEALKAFKELAAERRTEISELLQSYRPEAGHISEDREAIERVVDLLRRIEDDWPTPGAEDLRIYLRRLQGFGEQSQADRLRMRLAQVVGLPVISKNIVLDLDDVAEIEDCWPQMSEGFAEACRDALGTTPPVGSDKLVVWIKEAIQKEALLANLPLDERVKELDGRALAWAPGVLVRPSQVEEIVNSRRRALHLLANLSRSVGAAVLNEVIKVANGVAAGDSYSVLERETQKLHEDVERLAASLSEIAGSVRRPFSGETCSAVLAELDVARRAAEGERNKLHERILSLGRVVERLGGRPKPIPSPLTVPEAQRVAAAELQAATALLGQAWNRVTGRLVTLGLDIQFGLRSEGSTPEDDVVCVEAVSAWCDLAEKEASDLAAMGADFPDISAESRDGVLEELRAEVGRWKGQLNDVNERVRLIRLRLLRLGYREPDGKEESFADIREAKKEADRLNGELDTARGQRLQEASERAQGIYKALLSDDAGEYADIAPMRELRKAGLLRTIEDDL